MASLNALCDENKLLNRPLELADEVLQQRLVEKGKEEIDADWGLGDYFAKLSIQDSAVCSY